MKLKVQLVSVIDGHEDVREVADLARENLEPETLGLTLAESKSILKGLQEIFVEWQATAYLESQRHCPNCGKARHSKDSHQITVRTLFGNLNQVQSRILAQLGDQL